MFPLFTRQAEDMNPTTETHIQFVRRMIAMFLSLAGLAEMADKAPWPVRAFVVWVLGRAEAAAFDYVHWNAEPGDTISPFGDYRPETASELADSFRFLALMLDDELEQDRRFEDWCSRPNAHTVGRTSVLGTIRSCTGNGDGGLVARACRRMMTAIHRFAAAGFTRWLASAPCLRLDSS